MSTVAVVTSQVADEEWVFRALDGALVFVDQTHLADVCVVSADTLPMLVDHLPPNVAIVVIGDPAHPHPRASHVITRQWTDHDLRALLSALALGRPAPEQPLPNPSNPGEAKDAQRAIAAGRKLAAAQDLLQCESTIVEILVELLEVDRAYCLYFDHESNSVWSEAKLHGIGDERKAIAGMAGFAAHTGRIAVADTVGSDPRFVGLIDDPDGDGNDRLIAYPVYGADGFIHAILVATRRGRRAPFNHAEQLLLARFVKLVTPILDQLQIQVAAEAILEDAAGDGGLFRREAAEAQAAPRWGDVVRVSPGWLSWAYWFLVLLLAGSIAFIVIARVSTYSEGTAVISSIARTPISSSAAGNVSVIEVGPGDKVEAGSVVARFDDTEQATTVTRLEKDFETQLRNHMLDTADANADAALRNVRNELEVARNALDERLIRANKAGTIGDLRIRIGQRVEVGQVVASIVDPSKGLEVVAVLPGADRPQLTLGMPIQIELDGYRYAFQTLTIEEISETSYTSAQAAAIIGEQASTLALREGASVTLVRAKLVAEQFEVDGTSYKFHDGMTGRAQVRVRSEPIVFALIPGTRRFGE